MPQRDLVQRRIICLIPEIELVWDRDRVRVSDGHHNHREGWCCVCCAGIYVYTICDLSAAAPAAAALWNLTRNTLLIPLGRPTIKT